MSHDPVEHPPAPSLAAPLVTIVLPCFNEREHVIEEVARICAAMDASQHSYELLAIDDASTDDTLALLEDALPRFPQMRLMPFRRNGGSGTARRIGTLDGIGGQGQCLGDKGLRRGTAGTKDFVTPRCLTDSFESRRGASARPGAGRLGQGMDLVW